MTNIITENIIIALEISAHLSQPALNEHRQTQTTTFAEYITNTIGTIKSGKYKKFNEIKNNNPKNPFTYYRNYPVRFL